MKTFTDFDIPNYIPKSHPTPTRLPTTNTKFPFAKGPAKKLSQIPDLPDLGVGGAEDLSGYSHFSEWFPWLSLVQGTPTRNMPEQVENDLMTNSTNVEEMREVKFIQMIP